MMSRGTGIDDYGAQSAAPLSTHVDSWMELAVDYLDGRLSPEAKAIVKNHLEQCPECAARVRAQQSVVTFLQETSLEDPPEDLRDRVLGEMLFPSRNPSPSPENEEPSAWTKLWRRKVRPWIPAGIAVAAVFLAIVVYGVTRPSNNAPTASQQVVSSTTAGEDRAAGALGSKAGGSPQSSAGALAASPTTAAAATTTSARVVTTTAFATVLPPATQDKKLMVNNLKSAKTPAFLVFEARSASPSAGAATAEPATTALEGTTVTARTASGATGPSTTIPGETTSTIVAGAVSPEQADAVVSEIIAQTGMEPLAADLSLGGPTFAAFVPRDSNNMTQLVDLLSAIANELGLSVSVDMNPPVGQEAAVGRLLQSKANLPVLSAQETPQPAVAGYQFTTSTLVPSGGGPSGTAQESPDQAGTHVLVVVYVKS